MTALVHTLIVCSSTVFCSGAGEPLFNDIMPEVFTRIKEALPNGSRADRAQLWIIMLTTKLATPLTAIWLDSTGVLTLRLSLENSAVTSLCTFAPADLHTDALCVDAPPEGVITVP